MTLAMMVMMICSTIISQTSNSPFFLLYHFHFLSALALWYQKDHLPFWRICVYFPQSWTYLDLGNPVLSTRTPRYNNALLGKYFQYVAHLDEIILFGSVTKCSKGECVDNMFLALQVTLSLWVPHFFIGNDSSFMSGYTQYFGYFGQSKLSKFFRTFFIFIYGLFQ